MDEFRFAYPIVLALLVLPSLLYTVPALARWQPKWPTLRYSDIRLVSNAPVGWRVRLRRMPDILRLVAWGVLVVALARPQVGNAREIIRGQGVDIVLAVDISNSMAALDFEPLNRLESAKAVIADFIAGRRFDRIGLVVFAREAFHHAPLTLDYDVLLERLDDVQLVQDIVDRDGNPLLFDGTAIGLGIASSANMLRGSDSASQVIILLTDGENNAAVDPLAAAEAAQTLDIRIYTIAVGREGEVPVPDQEGNIIYVESELNEQVLMEIAQLTEGQYFRAQDLANLQVIYDQIDSLERSDVELQVVVRWQDRGTIPLVIAFFMLLSERLLRHSVLESVP